MSKKRVRGIIRRQVKEEMRIRHEALLSTVVDSELKLERAIKDWWGIEVIRQFQVGFYYIDLVLPDRLLAIEIDGPSHDRSIQKARDTKKERLIIKSGFRFLRINNRDLDRLDWVKQSIERFPKVYNYQGVFWMIKKRVEGFRGYLLSRVGR